MTQQKTRANSYAPKFDDPERILAAIEKIDNAIQITSEVRVVLDNVIHAVLQIFQSDRAWLFYPCNSEVSSFDVSFESTTAAYPGAKALRETVPMTQDMADYCHRALSQVGQPDVDPPVGGVMTNDISIHFNVKSLMFMALQPQIGDAWMFGLHQCDHCRCWTNEDKTLFRIIGRRITDCIGNMLYLNQLKESEEKYRRLVNAAPYGIQLTDVEGKIIFSNPAHHKIQGYKNGDLIGKFIWDLIAEDDGKTKTKKYYDHIISEQPPPEVYFNVDKTNDGRLINVQVNWDYIRNDHGEVTGIISIISDETEKKRAENALIKSELKFKNLIQTASDAIFLLSKDGKVLDVNPAACAILDRSKDDILTLDIHEIDPNFTTAEFIHFWTDIPFNTPMTFETTHQRSDGSLVPVEVSGQKFQIDNEIFYYGIARNISERKKAEKKLTDSEAKYRTILKSAMDGFWLTDANGRLLEVNNAYCIMSGYRVDELLSMRISDLEAIEDARRVTERVSQIIQKGTDRFESRHRRKNGTVFDVEVSIQYRPQDGGQYIFFLHDITERKQTFEAVKAANEKMRLAADAAHFGIWDLDVKSNRLEWDDWMFRLYGMSRDHFGGAYEAWQAGVHPDDLEQISQEVEQALRGEKEFDTKFRIVRTDGEVRYLKAHATVSRDSHGNPIQMTGINYDITERMKAGVALKDSENRFRALHNASFGGITIHDKGLILECNKGLSEITGYEYDELIGMDGLSLISDDTREQVIRNIAAGYEKPYEATGVRKNGELYPLRLEARNIPYQGKDVRVVEFRDITETKRAEKERRDLEGKLRQAQKMEAVGRLAGGVAHDFNNMLSVIIGHVEMGLEQIDASQPLYAGLEEIRKAGERSAELTRQLLAFARKQTVAPKVLDLNEIVEQMLKMLKRLIGEDIDLAWLPGKRLWPVRIDPSQIDQILANLCVNARDAIADVGKVTIETGTAEFDAAYCADHAGFKTGEYVLLAVSDNGCGMDAETLNNIFEPFFTTKETGRGTGLGLATVYGVIKQNNGFINVYSEPQQGTIFRIYFPRHRTQAAGLPEKVNDQPVERGHETILLVEDETAILEMTTMMLERLGYQVLPAETPGEAIRLAREHAGAIDLLMTDVIMPEMNGRDLAGNILALHPNLRRLFMSGYTSNVIAHHGVLDKGVNFIQKPFSKKDLAAKVREVLHAPAPVIQIHPH